MNPAEFPGSPIEGANQTDDKLIIQNNIIPSGSEDGDNSLSQGIRNEPEPDTQLGHGNGSDTISGLSSDGMPLNVTEIVDRFMVQTRTRLKPESQARYAMTFRRFVKDVDLTQYTRRQLMGPKGRMLILQNLEHISRPSWRFVIAAIKPVWTYGLNIAWPIDSRRDLPKLPRTRQKQTPPDSVILRWKKALANETDEYLRLIWLFVAQHGWRPSHVRLLKWRNIQYDESGRPRAIVADGLTESFKTSSPIATRLSPDVVEILIAWEKRNGRQNPDCPILPWRSLIGGRIESMKILEPDQFRSHWLGIEKKWGLPRLRPSEIRHWVATTSRKSGLSKQASACLMGHDPTQGGSMRDWYDSPQLEDIFAEQEDRLPNGPLGFLDPLTIEIEGGLPKEIVDIVARYLNNELSTYDLGSQIEKIKNVRLSANIPKITT